MIFAKVLAIKYGVIYLNAPQITRLWVFVSPAPLLTALTLKKNQIRVILVRYLLYFYILYKVVGLIFATCTQA